MSETTYLIRKSTIDALLADIAANDTKTTAKCDLIDVVVLGVDDVSHKIEYCYAKYYGQSNCRGYSYNVPPQLRNDEFYDQFEPKRRYKVVSQTTEKGGWLWTDVRLMKGEV